MADRYPVIHAGQDIDADTINAMIPMIVSKPSATARASTTTLADDPDLTVQLEANSTYFVEFHIHYAALDAAKIKTQWTVPSGATGNRCVIGMGEDGYAWTTAEAGLGATDADAARNTLGRFGVHNYGTTVIYGTRDHATNQAYAQETATVVTSSAGTLALSWAQNTSNATATTVYDTSLMRVTKIG